MRQKCGNNQVWWQMSSLEGENANIMKQWLLPSVNYKLKAIKFLFCLPCNSHTPHPCLPTHSPIPHPPQPSPTPGKKHRERKGRLATNLRPWEQRYWPCQATAEMNKNFLLHDQHGTWSRGRETAGGRLCSWGSVGSTTAWSLQLECSELTQKQEWGCLPEKYHL